MKPCYSTSLDEALRFAADAFRGRRRKGSDTPYLMHLLQVAAVVGEHGGDEEQIIAAVLHDYLEDIPGASHRVLQDRFGPGVADIVAALSDSTGHPKPPWKARKVAYCERIRRESSRTRLVCAADKLHNAQSIQRDHRMVGDAVWGRFSALRHETLWYYRTVLGALGEGWTHPLLDELDHEVLGLHRLAGEPWPERWL